MFLLSLIILVNADLQSNIRLYNSDTVSKSDVRFQFATQRHFSGQDIKIEIVSNESGDLRFSGAFERSKQTGYQLIYSVFNDHNERVETKCNTFFCDIKLSKQLFFDGPNMLTWNVKTDPSWSLGAHEIASGTFFWDYVYNNNNKDEEVRIDANYNISCSNRAFLTKSISDGINADGTVLYTAQVFDVYLQDRLCFKIDDPSNRTLFIVEIVNYGLRWETPVILSDSYTYSWIQTNEIVEDWWRNEGAVWIIYQDLSRRTISQKFKQWYDDCSWPTDAGVNVELQWDYDTSALGRTKFPGISNPIITTAGTSEFSCDGKNDFDLYCNPRKNVLHKTLRADLLSFYPNYPNKPANPFLYPQNPWSPNYPIDGIDAETLSHFTPSDAWVQCEGTAPDSNVHDDHKGRRQVTGTCLSVERSESSNSCDTFCLHQMWKFTARFRTLCKSRRIRPNRFFRGFKAGTKVSKYWELGVKITDMNTPNSSKSSRMRVDLTGSNGGTIDIVIPGDNRVITILTDSIDAGYNENQFGLYEVQSGTYKQMVQNSFMPRYDRDPLLSSSDKSSHTCNDKGPCVLKNGLYNTGFNGPTSEDRKLDEFIHPQNYATWSELYNPVMHEQTGELVGLRTNLTNLAVKKISIIGSFNITEIITDVEPVGELLSTKIKGVCSSDNNLCVKLNITAYSTKASGSVLVDISTLTGAIDVQPRAIVLGTKIETYSICVTASMVNCSLNGSIVLVGTNTNSKINIDNVTLIRDGLITPTLPNTFAPVKPGAPVSSIMSPTGRPSSSPPTIEPSSEILPVWAWIAIGVVVLLMFGLVYYFYFSEEDDMHSRII